MSHNVRQLLYHSTALIVVAIWGSTFIFTKILLMEGLSPANIFTLRFIIAYLMLLAFELAVMKMKKMPFRWLSRNCKDELIMAGLGLTGGSLYFLSENAAMLFTSATNTSLIVCSCPLFTMLAMALVYRDEHFTARQLAGSLIALAGMAAVVCNGHFVLHQPATHVGRGVVAQGHLRTPGVARRHFHGSAFLYRGGSSAAARKRTRIL